MQPILNPEHGRFICTGPAARTNADVLAQFEVDRGLKAVVLDADGRVTVWGQNAAIEKMSQQLIANADIIIDVIR